MHLQIGAGGGLHPTVSGLRRQYSASVTPSAHAKHDDINAKQHGLGLGLTGTTGSMTTGSSDSSQSPKN